MCVRFVYFPYRECVCVYVFEMVDYKGIQQVFCIMEKITKLYSTIFFYMYIANYGL